MNSTWKKIFLGLFLISLSLSQLLASVPEEYVKRDMSLLYESLVQVSPLLEQFQKQILPIATKVEADPKYMLTISESQTIDFYWERFMDIRLSLHTLYASYQDQGNSDPTLELLRTGALIGLVYPASIVVRRFWDSPRMIKIFDGAANTQIPFGSFVAMQNEVFYQQRDIGNNRGNGEFLLMLPAIDLEKQMEKWEGIRNSYFFPRTSLMTQIEQLSEIFYRGYQLEKPFYSSWKNQMTLWGRNAVYKFKNAFYKNFLKVSTWIGDTKIKRIDPNYYNGKTLIKLPAAYELEKKLRTGDVMTSRSNWFLSNAFLPGFWPHSFIYLGNVKTMTSFFAGDQETQKFYAKKCVEEKLNCKDFTGFLKNYVKTRAAWDSFNQKDDHGYEHVLIEATSEGVHFSSVRHTFLNDYLGVLRPKLSRLQIARTIENTFYHFGKEYDFYLDWASDDRIVCSELVSKSYQSDLSSNKVGIDFNYSIPDKMYVEWVMGRIAIPVVNIVRKAYDENVLHMRTSQFDFVAFLKGVRKTDSSVYGSESEYYDSRLWPKWSFMTE